MIFISTFTLLMLFWSMLWVFGFTTLSRVGELVAAASIIGFIASSSYLLSVLAVRLFG